LRDDGEEGNDRGLVEVAELRNQRKDENQLNGLVEVSRV